jgi:hypothetical protein
LGVNEIPVGENLAQDAAKFLPSPQISWSAAMMDAVMIAIGLIFFAVSIAYVYACEQL